MTSALWVAPAGAALLLGVLRGAFLSATVRGASMLPTLAPGDRILVVRRWLARRPRRDDVVVVRMSVPAPTGGWRRELLVKRVGGASGDRPVFGEQMLLLGAREIFVIGDNPERSFDSREFGALPIDDVVGKMVCRLSRASDVATA